MTPRSDGGRKSESGVAPTPSLEAQAVPPKGSADAGPEGSPATESSAIAPPENDAEASSEPSDEDLASAEPRARPPSGIDAAP